MSMDGVSAAFPRAAVDGDAVPAMDEAPALAGPGVGLVVDEVHALTSDATTISTPTPRSHCGIREFLLYLYA